MPLECHSKIKKLAARPCAMRAQKFFAGKFAEKLFLKNLNTKAHNIHTVLGVAITRNVRTTSYSGFVFL